MVLKLGKSAGLCFFFLLALVLAPASVWSQDYQAEGQQGYEAEGQQGYEAEGQAAQVDVSDEDMEAFAKAQNKVEEIRQKYQSKLSDVEDQTKRQEMVQKMNEELVDAVKNSGLSVERYNEIFEAAQNDSQLQQRISETMQSIR
ncbi:MAG: DUF4168 domain-containing protein [Candidatus Omnitrophota bacterium]